MALQVQTAYFPRFTTFVQFLCWSALSCVGSDELLRHSCLQPHALQDSTLGSAMSFLLVSSPRLVPTRLQVRYQP